ncbi:MAG: dTDP-glucose 4,6-dehydratase [Proteobacteria bacterium]|nr:dTDP-glucose 4,6-dehydratase [Pseudomonadota bacterium]
MANKRVLVTGGAGFIGSALCRHLVAEGRYEVLNLDKLTYAADLASLAGAAGSTRYGLEIADICNGTRLREIFAEFRPGWVFHLAAETHVDRSIDGPEAFLETNVVGTQRLLTAALDYWRGLESAARTAFRFVHVSTDEVYGTLGPTGVFTEESPYRPNSPYAASKAAADHLARAWHSTYGLPVVISNCSNNYGPYQFPEKLIPHMIIRAVDGRTLPVYGQGLNVRDWLFVGDHVTALIAVAERGRIGEKYNIGGHGERRNIDVVRSICRHLDRLRPLSQGHYADSIAFVDDRPGHDLRYAIDPTKTERELGWQRSGDFEIGLAETVAWYLDNEAWWRAKLAAGYQADRLGSALTP